MNVSKFTSDELESIVHLQYERIVKLESEIQTSNVYIDYLKDKLAKCNPDESEEHDG